MADQPLRFDDGAAYETMMGVWSRLAGEVFLDWLKPAPGLSWIDIGCGSGAFTELIVGRCAPARVEGIDPSEGQLAYARQRPSAKMARFRQGDAMALPFADKEFDAAIMALVIFFVPEPTKGVAEMARLLRPGGIAAAYAWDIEGGGFPLEPFWAEMRAMGLKPGGPPRPEAATMKNLRKLWSSNGLDAIETREITVERTFESFDEYWAIAMTAPGFQTSLAALRLDNLEQMKARMQKRLAPASAGKFTYQARANAVKGMLPR